jgi:imidazolonepropionase-like amidohydrolase
VHFFGVAGTDGETLTTTPGALAGARCARDAAATLNAGFTSVREVGGYGIDFSKAINEGWIPGPRIYAAGAPISQTAGHGDIHEAPLSLVQSRIAEFGGMPYYLADGVEQAILAVRKQIRRGAQVIKICATGGVLSRIDSPRAAQFNKSELEAMVEEAVRTNLVVAAHAHGTSGIIAAIKAGVHTIEHGSYLDEEAINLMLERNVMLIATRFVQTRILKSHDGLPDVEYQKLIAVEKANFESYKAAIKAGIWCALGTDLGVSNEKDNFMHGENGQEFPLAVKAGMTPLQAIEAGTANAPFTLGDPQNELSPAPFSGQLKEGYDADFIAVAADPTKDIGLLAQPEKVTHVWKGGVLVKGPGRPVGLC